MKQAIFLVAFTIYMGLNLLVLPFCDFNLDQYDYSYRSWPWWVVHHLRSTEESFNVALLGSSLMLSSINECDANFAKKNIDATTHHQSLYLDDKLHTAFAGNFKTFNLATPGQMPSDAYFLIKAMLQLKQHPKIVVYGIAPRDFLDSRLASPADTEPFRYLKRFVSASEVSYDVFGLGLASIDNLLSNCLFLHQHAVDFQCAFSRRIDKVLQAVVPAPTTNTPFTYWDRVALLPQYKAGELYPEAAVNSPVVWEPGTHWKRDNIEDYLERYRKPNPESLKLQLRFLNRLISFCQEENIEIVLVNMPLSRLNINILGQKRYAEFESKIRTVCIARNVKLIDPGSTAAFPNEYFEDSAHLNGTGGRRLLDLFTKGVQDDSELANVFVEAGKPIDLASGGHPGPGAE